MILGGRCHQTQDYQEFTNLQPRQNIDINELKFSLFGFSSEIILQSIDVYINVNYGFIPCIAIVTSAAIDFWDQQRMLGNRLWKHYYATEKKNRV